MGLRVFDDDNGFILLNDSDVPVGWIRGRDLGFGYFGSEQESMIAARGGYDALAGWVARLGRSRPLPPLGTGKLRVTRDGDEAWITDRSNRVARLVRPVLPGAEPDDQLGIELQLPAGVGAVAAIGGAQVVYSAIVRAIGHDTAPAPVLAGEGEEQLRA